MQKLCQRSSLENRKLDSFIESVFANVRSERDMALLAYTKQFDSVELGSICMAASMIKLQAAKTPVKLREAIDVACNNITKFHKSQELDVNKETVETVPGVVCWRESRPIERVGLYVPGGTAPLVSTVLMLGIPAKIAGCEEIVVCTPPNSDGTIEPAICYAALKIGVTKLIRVGGAQAIAGLAFGTESVPKVDKIFGPGNQYVTAAKLYAMNYGVAIDMPAGPSEVMVVADQSAVPAYVAADLLSQAEHGPDSQVVLVATNDVIVRNVQAAIKLQLTELPRKDIVKESLANSFCVVVKNLKNALEFANAYAPEHIILSVSNPKKWAQQVVNAGSVFLGNYSPESAGDYASGTNHTLPTGGWARSYGGVSLDSFVKKVTFQSLSRTGLQALAPTIETLAEAEGLAAHKRAVTIRLNNKL